jgi:glycerophosphoryl diester phosphodiesterase
MRIALLVWLLALLSTTAAVALGADHVTTNAVKKSPVAAAVEAQRVLVIAHRGNSKVAPENTLPSFASAVKVGVDFVELDYYHSADGALVVFHDKTLDRCTDACQKWGGKKIPLAARSLAELRTLDAGTWFDAKFAGTRIPTLEEACDTIQPGSMTLIERKDGDAAACLALLRRKKLISRVAVQAFDWKYLAGLHRLAPEVVLGALGDKKLTPKRLSEIESCGARFVGWKHEDLTKADIDRVHAKGLKAWTYTVDDPKTAAVLLDWGIDGLISNVPARMKQVVAGHMRAGK